MDLLHIDDYPQVSLEYIQIQALELKELFGIRLVIIDYLQLLHIESAPSHQDWRMIAEGLQNLAITLDAPVLVISQLKKKESTKTTVIYRHQMTFLVGTNYPATSMMLE